MWVIRSVLFPVSNQIVQEGSSWGSCGCLCVQRIYLSDGNDCACKTVWLHYWRGELIRQTSLQSWWGVYLLITVEEGEEEECIWVPPVLLILLFTYMTHPSAHVGLKSLQQTQGAIHSPKISGNFALKLNVGLVPPEKFPKSRSTFLSGPLFSAGPVQSKLTKIERSMFLLLSTAQNTLRNTAM